MSKDYNDYSTQVAVAQNDKKTICVYGNLVAAEPHRFAELLSDRSKFKVHINDFSSGKGDKAVKTDYNLDVKELEYILKKAPFYLLPNPYKKTKSFDAYPEQSGEFKGLCKVSHFTIEYDKTRNYPWKIIITNGYGKKGEISKGKKTAMYFLIDEDFLDMFQKAKDYLDEFRRVCCPQLISNGLNVIAQQSRGYSNNIENPTPQYDQPETAYETQPESPKQNTQPTTQPNQSEPQKNTSGRDIHTMKVKFISDFMKLQNSWVVKCSIGGKEYTLYLQDVSEELQAARANGTEVTANLYSYNGSLCFDSLA